MLGENLTLFAGEDELNALPIGEALKSQPDDVHCALFDALLQANDDAVNSDLVLRLVLRNTFRRTLENYYFSPEGKLKLMRVLRACYNKTDPESLEYLFYTIGGIPAVTALFLEADTDPSIPGKIKTLSPADIEDLVKHICCRPRHDTIDLWSQSETHLLKRRPGARHTVRGIVGRPKKGSRVKNNTKVKHDAKHNLKVEPAKHEQISPPNVKRKRSLDQLPLLQHNASYYGSQMGNSAHILSAGYPITTSASLDGYYSTGPCLYGNNHSEQVASSLLMDVNLAQQVPPQSYNQNDSQTLNMSSPTYAETAVLLESRQLLGQEKYSQQQQQQQQEQQYQYPPKKLTAKPGLWSTRQGQQSVEGFDGQTGQEDYAQYNQHGQHDQRQCSRLTTPIIPSLWTTRDGVMYWL